jgi:hypothetical protein
LLFLIYAYDFPAFVDDLESIGVNEKQDKKGKKMPKIDPFTNLSDRREASKLFFFFLKSTSEK